MGVMGILNIKLDDHKKALEVIRERGLQLRQLSRALDRVGLVTVSGETQSIADDLIDEARLAQQAMDTIVSEVFAEKPREPEESSGEEEAEEAEAVAEVEEREEAAVAAAAPDHFGA
jgi:hypothetical protein